MLLYSIPSANSVKSKLFRTQDVYRKIQKLKENDRLDQWPAGAALQSAYV